MGFDVNFDFKPIDAQFNSKYISYNLVRILLDLIR